MRARIDCCGARIEGFNIGLFNQEMGGLPVGAAAVFGTYQAPGIYNFTTLNTCVNVGAISTGVAAALTDLQNSTISTLTEQLIPLSSIMAAEVRCAASALLRVLVLLFRVESSVCWCSEHVHTRFSLTLSLPLGSSSSCVSARLECLGIPQCARSNDCAHALVSFIHAY